MKRVDILRQVALRDGLTVVNLGFPARELYSVCDRPDNFYMLGSMGMASSIGLGLALSQPNRVYVIDGDGSILMNTGSLVTIAHHAPDNLCVVIVNNRCYGSTGNQATYTAGRVDLRMLADAAGNKDVLQAYSEKSLREALDRVSGRSGIIVADAEPGNADVPVIDIEPLHIKKRFMTALAATRSRNHSPDHHSSGKLQ